MAALINHAILAELQSLYPYMKITPFTAQQETLLMLVLEGATTAAASRGAGYSSPSSAAAFLNSDKAIAVQQYFSEKAMEKITITRDHLTRMALECYGERGNAGEGLKAVEVLARLHGQNEEARQKKGDTTVTINQQNNTVVQGQDPKALKKKMAAMSDTELLEYASKNFQGLDLEPQAVNREKAIEGELIEMESTPNDENPTP